MSEKSSILRALKMLLHIMTEELIGYLKSLVKQLLLLTAEEMINIPQIILPATADLPIRASWELIL